MERTLYGIRRTEGGYLLHYPGSVMTVSDPAEIEQISAWIKEAEKMQLNVPNYVEYNIEGCTDC